MAKLRVRCRKSHGEAPLILRVSSLQVYSFSPFLSLSLYLRQPSFHIGGSRLSVKLGANFGFINGLRFALTERRPTGTASSGQPGSGRGRSEPRRQSRAAGARTGASTRGAPRLPPCSSVLHVSLSAVSKKIGGEWRFPAPPLLFVVSSCKCGLEVSCTKHLQLHRRLQPDGRPAVLSATFS